MYIHAPIILNSREPDSENSEEYSEESKKGNGEEYGSISASGKSTKL